MTEGQADLHIHSSGSDGVLSVEQILDQADRIGLTAVAITDHDNVRPSRIAREMAARKRMNLEVVTGAEVTAKWFKHLLAYNIEEDIPYGLPLLLAIRRIHKAGGLVAVAHPLVPLWPASLSVKDVLTVMHCLDPEVYFDAFEVINGSIKNARAQGFYDQHLAKTCAAVTGSDAHFRVIGKAVTIYPRELGIVSAIKERRTTVQDKNVWEKRTISDLILNISRASKRNRSSGEV